jgi:DNA-binding NarL/FixJ family response regulator
MTFGSLDMPSRSSSIFLIDDHPLVRLWLGQLIEEHGDLVVCGEADNARDALQRIPVTNPDLVIVDLSLPGGSGMELIKSLKTLFPNLLMIVLSMHDESVYAERAIRAGARGFVMKRATADHIIEAIYKVLRGKLAVSDAVAQAFADKFGDGRAPPVGPTVERLSDRELEIFELLGSGLDTRAIGNRLGISIKTVQAHCSHIKEKLELANATDLLREALRWFESHPH